MMHELKIKIYYEDTDCGGVVYYANYLRYLERARTEFLASRGIDLKKLMDQGIYFVVSEAALKYFSPGRYGDVLSVGTDIEKIGPASITFAHVVERDHDRKELVRGSVRIGCVGSDMRPLRMSAEIMGAVSPAGSADRIE